MLNPEMRAVYASTLKQAVETACFPLFDWEAFAADCSTVGEPQMASLAHALFSFQCQVKGIIDPQVVGT